MVRPNGHEPEWVELRSLTLGVHDILIVRAGERVSVAWVQRLQAVLRKANPAWTGTIVTIGIDQQLETLSEDQARNMYDQLRRRFGDRRERRRGRERKS